MSGLTVERGGARILDDVSFSLHTGEVLALLGPSGSGKSTTLQCIVGESQHEGEIDIFGRKDASDLKRAVGYVSQRTELYPDMTVRENVGYFGRQYGLGGADLAKRTDDILRALGLHDRADQRLRTLSGGQQRRASIAATLVHEPALLILDEPTSGLDPTTRRNLWRYVRQAARDLGVSVLVTTHFLEEAELADRVVILHRGRVVAAGAPEALARALPGGGTVLAIALRDLDAEGERKLAELLAQLERDRLVEKHEVNGLNVRLFTSEPTRAQRRLLDALPALDIHARKMATEDADMHDVFAHHAGESFQESDDR